MASAVPKVVKQNKTTRGDVGGDTCIRCGRQTKPCENPDTCAYLQNPPGPKD